MSGFGEPSRCCGTVGAGWQAVRESNEVGSGTAAVAVDPRDSSVNLWRHVCVIAPDTRFGDNIRIGNFVFIRDHVVIGADCTIGSYVDIEGDVQTGDRVSLQSGCYLTRGVVIEDDVFCGPR